MSRKRLLRQLDAYAERWPEEAAVVDRMVSFVARRRDCFERSCREGHITASAWVVSPGGEAVLLVLHRKLGIWLQPGGHADGNGDTLAVARAEAREESGVDSAPVVGATIFDVDVHDIPARPGEPAHLHYDVRHRLAADPDLPLVPSPECEAVAWVPIDRIGEYTREESVLRMVRKTTLAAGGTSAPA
ncbi:MAG: NUDIX hydrolase [Thermoanaerobaculia bacterium]|nr:NUDIX hydrolase [Thermoanaerobaculia bacterium]